MPVAEEEREEEGKRDGAGCSPEGELAGAGRAGSFVLRLLFLSCRWESQGEVSGEGFSRYSSVFQVCSFRVVVSTDWSVPGRSH